MNERGTERKDKKTDRQADRQKHTEVERQIVTKTKVRKGKESKRLRSKERKINE